MNLDFSSYLSDAEVCGRLGISQDTLDRMVKKGLRAYHRPIPGRRPQRCFDPDDIAARMPQTPAKVVTETVSASAREMRESARELRQSQDGTDPSMMMIAHLIDVAVAARIEIAAHQEPDPDPMYITLARAAETTGLPVPQLRQVIDQEGLDAIHGKRRAIMVRGDDLAIMDVSSLAVKPGALGKKKRKGHGR